MKFLKIVQGLCSIHAKDTLATANSIQPEVRWLLTEYDPVGKNAFGYVRGMAEDEKGYVSLTEFESITGPIIDRDLYLQQQWLSECVANVGNTHCS